MGSPYSSTSVSGYNANPPPDDGTTVATNKITWSGIKSKIGDPLNTFASAVDSALTTAFGKTVSGASVVSTAVDYPMTSADQGRLIVVTVSGKIVTTPDAATVHSPFVFSVANQSTGTITLAGNAAGGQTVDGQTSQVIRPGSGCLAWTDGTNWFTSGLKPAQIQSTNPPYGFGPAVNLQLNASVGSSLLTIAVKTNSGSDPTSSDPVLIPFRDSTVANGDPVWQKVTAALSINTNAAGATLGASNNVPFRFWIVAFDNGGTVVLGLMNCSTSTQIFSLDEYNTKSSTAISAAATAAGTFYTPNGTTVSSKSFTILGWLEYSAGLATAGTYNIAPTKLQLFGPGSKKPGDVVQAVYSTTTSQTNCNSTTKVATSLTGSITTSSNANSYRVRCSGYCEVNTGGAANVNLVEFQIWRNTGAVAVGTLTLLKANNGATLTFPLAIDGFDTPASSNWPPTQYGVYGTTNSGSNTNQFNGTGTVTGTSVMTIEEIMG